MPAKRKTLWIVMCYITEGAGIVLTSMPIYSNSHLAIFRQWYNSSTPHPIAYEVGAWCQWLARILRNHWWPESVTFIHINTLNILHLDGDPNKQTLSSSLILNTYGVMKYVREDTYCLRTSLFYVMQPCSNCKLCLVQYLYKFSFF